MINDTDNNKLYFLYGQKNIYTVNVTKSQYNEFIFLTYPVISPCIYVPNHH